jgi:hypothetical protein
MYNDCFFMFVPLQRLLTVPLIAVAMAGWYIATVSLKLPLIAVAKAVLWVKFNQNRVFSRCNGHC